MAKITVDLEAFYGYGCSGHGYGSNEAIEVEISDSELAALKQLGEAEVSAEAVVEAIEEGDTTLESLHEKLSDVFYNMVEEYWLFEAYNECLYDSLEEAIKSDIADGLYEPTYVEDDDDDSFDSSCCAGEDADADGADDYEDDDCEDDEENDNECERSYDLDAYYEWVKKHDHWFIAERVGLDLDACHDDEVSYTIHF